MGDITTSKNFTAGETVTASDLNAIMSGSAIAAGVIVNADVNASAAIDLSKLNTADDMDANSYQVGATEVIDSSRNLTNINNATIGGTLGVTGNASFTTFSATGVCAFSANVDFTGLGATTDLHAGITNLGASATQQINMNGTFAGTPTIAGATFASGSDKVLFLDADDSDSIKTGTVTIPSIDNQTSSASIPSAGSDATLTHGHGSVTPQQVRMVLRCVTDDSAQTGYAVGDEVSIEHAINGNDYPCFCVRVANTSITVKRSSSASNAIQVLHKTSGVTTSITTEANWQIKAYSTYFS